MKKFIKNLESTITDQEDLEKFATSKLSVVTSVPIELKSKPFICGICDCPLVSPRETGCCRKKVCRKCILEPVKRMITERIGYPLRYLCCNELIPEDVLYRCVIMSDEGRELTEMMIAGVLSVVMLDCSAFFIRKLQTGAFKCNGGACEVRSFKLLNN